MKRFMMGIGAASLMGVVALAGCGEKSESSAPATEKEHGDSAKGTTGPAASAKPKDPTVFKSPVPNSSSVAIAPTSMSTSKPRRTTRVKAANAQAASGRLTIAQVEEAIDANFDALSACTPEEVVVTMKALVGANGKVIESTATRSTPDDPRIRDCVAQAFKHIQFPAASGGAPAPLSFDLSLGAG